MSIAAHDHARLTLTGKERFLEQNDIIVSKTNEKGIMTYVNKTFLDISDYREEEMLDKPHNAIRHPHMPRAVFKLLWSQIKEGKEIFAYVVNRCKHGDHYWVFAHITPCIDTKTGALLGYHSSRRAPKRDAIRQLEPLYKQMREVEDRMGGSKGVEESTKLLTVALQQANMSYDQFILSF